MIKQLTPLLLTLLLAGCANTPIGSGISSAIAPKPTGAPKTLPQDFPFPLYENAQLLEAQAGRVILQVENEGEAIKFYRAYLDQQEWERLSQTDNQVIRFNSQYLATITANKQEISLEYVKLQSPIVVPRSDPPQPTTPIQPPATPQTENKYITDLQRLGIVPPDFNPNATILRREYARWLVTANNRLFQDRPAQQIRPALPDRELPLFKDVPQTDPDFGLIQGLANAGIIDRSSKEFQPDRALTREVLVQWKAPLDARKPIPPASSNAVQSAWNFQDSNKISPGALGAVLQDSRAGELSNIRRSFGFTILFQPQKHVSRSEAATALWYFGDGTTGISAPEVLQKLP